MCGRHFPTSQGLNLQKHHDCSHRSTKHQFWTRAKYDHNLPISRGSQDGLPLWQPFWTNPRSVLNINDITLVGLSSMGNPFMMLFCSFDVHDM